MKINQSDLSIINRIFFGKTDAIHFLNIDNEEKPVLDAFVSNKKRRIKGYHRLSLKYINNPDGTIRWMFPSAIKKPLFLNLYNTSSVLGKLRKVAMGMLYRLRLGGFFMQELYLYSLDETSVPACFQSKKKYAVFFGTRGAERKVVVAAFEKDKPCVFYKIPFGERAKSLVNNEFRVLGKVNQFNFKNVQIPHAQKDGGVIALTNIKRTHSKSVLTPDKRHVSFLAQLYQNTIATEVIANQPFFEKINKRIANLTQTRDDLGSHHLVPLMRDVFDNIDEYSFMPLALMHGDFTPWNSFVTKGNIQVYDWERGQEKMPVLYDLIHFVVQTGVLVKQQQPKEIIEEIKRTFDRADVRTLCRQYSVQLDTLMKVYFVDQFSYLLSLYQTQSEALHAQSYWICETAKGLLEAIHEPESSYRRVFIHQLFVDIKEDEYALMKFTEGTLENIAESSDLDICVSKKVAKRIMAKIENNPRVLKTKLYRKSFMQTLRVYFNDHSFLSIDFIHKFERKSFKLLKTNEVLQNIGLTLEGVKVPQPQIDFEYKFLFYQLNAADFPQKYVNYYFSLPEGKQKSILQYINEKYDLDFTSLKPLMNYTAKLSLKVFRELKGKGCNNLLRRCLRGMRYVVDALKQLIVTKGMIITVSGVDGAGKSTFINGLKSELSEKFRHKVVVLRHRPSILPILSVYKYGKEEAHARATAMMPRTGGNKNKITSVIRFGYYFLDYLIGQFYVQLRYVRRGYLVIFDRYYFDFISDPKRTNLVLPSGLPKALYRFVLNPEINVLLYADPMMILQRKKELSREDIVSLTKSYLTLFRTYSYKYKSSKFMTIENIDLNESLSKTIHEYIMAS